jgi:hypothetical protein
VCGVRLFMVREENVFSKYSKFDFKYYSLYTLSFRVFVLQGILDVVSKGRWSIEFPTERNAGNL